MCENHSCGNKDCKSDDHINHLCFLLSDGIEEKNPDQLKTITEEPQFQCHTCGRTSHSADNVCMPIEL